MEDIDKVKAVLFGINGTDGLIKKVDDIDNKLVNAISKHNDGWQVHKDKNCGVDCKGAIRMNTHETQHEELLKLTTTLSMNQLEERKSRRQVLIAIIAASVPGVINLIMRLFP